MYSNLAGASILTLGIVYGHEPGGDGMLGNASSGVIGGGGATAGTRGETFDVVVANIATPPCRGRVPLDAAWGCGRPSCVGVLAPA